MKKREVGFIITDVDDSAPHPRRVTVPAPVVSTKRGGNLETTATPRVERRWLSLLAGVGTAAISSALIATGVIPEIWGLLFVGALIVVVPTAPRLAERVALNSALLVGWAPLLWWVAWPVSVNHAALLVAAVVGGVTVWVVAAPAPNSRISTLCPEVRLSDALLPIAVAAAMAATAPLSLASSPLRALSAMLPGADNWAHFAMFNGIRFQGAIPRVTGDAPDGTPWAFAAYPRGFHTLAATLSEIGTPHIKPGPDSVVTYAHAAGFVVVLGVVLVTSSILAVPGVSARPVVALPAVTFALTALLWEPGQKVLANGFASFWLGAAAGGSALLMATFKPFCSKWLQVASIGGLLVCVATTWAPLLIVAAPAALMPLVRDRNQGAAVGRRTKMVTILLIVVVGVVASAVLLNLLRSVSLRFLVTEVSGFNGTSPIPTFLMLVALVWGVGRSLLHRNEAASFSRVQRRRLALLLLAVVLGVGSLTAVLIVQLRLIGTTSYYFLKYLVGFELILACVGAGVLAGIVAHLAPVARASWRSWAIGAALALASTQIFVPLWQQSWLLFSESDDGTASIATPYSRLPMARGILEALHHETVSSSFDTEYLPLGPGNAVQIFYPDAWFHAAEGSASTHVADRMAVLRAHANDVDAVAPLVQQVLQMDDQVTILVPEEFLASLRAALPQAMAHRVLPMDGS